MENLERALLVAEQAHKGQRYGIYPYMYHVHQVVEIAEALGYDEDIQVACALHDTLEDTDLTFSDIEKEFGYEIADIVFCVTDELGRNRNERKTKTYPKIRANWKATVVKILDRLVNTEESFRNNQKKFKMYKSEHDIFCSSLMCKDHPHEQTNKAWVKLNLFMQNK